VTHHCVIPKCGPVSDHDWIPAIGENSGKIWVCRKHRSRVELGKSVLGAGALAAFQVGMDTAHPGLREKIYDAGSTIMGIVSHFRNAKTTE